VWLSAAVAYGAHTVLLKTMLSPGFMYQLSIVDAADNTIVYADNAMLTNWEGYGVHYISPYPINIDPTTDAALVVLSADPGGNMITSVYGVGVTSPTTSKWVGVNLKYGSTNPAATASAFALRKTDGSAVTTGLINTAGSIYCTAPATLYYKYGYAVYSPTAPTQLSGYKVSLGGDGPITLPATCASAGCVSYTIVTSEGVIHVRYDGAPTLSPTVAPTGPTANSDATVSSVRVSQTLTGVSLSTATSSSFETAFAAAVAAVLSMTGGLKIPPSAVTSYTAVDTRRTLLAGVAVSYTVALPASTPAQVAAFTTAVAGSGPGLAASLSVAGYSVTVSTPVVATGTSAPSGSPPTEDTTKGRSPRAGGAISVGAAVGAFVGFFALAVILRLLTPTIRRVCYSKGQGVVPGVEEGPEMGPGVGMGMDPSMGAGVGTGVGVGTAGGGGGYPGMYVQGDVHFGAPMAASVQAQPYPYPAAVTDGHYIADPQKHQQLPQLQYQQPTTYLQPPPFNQQQQYQQPPPFNQQQQYQQPQYGQQP
jgi:hypothetical protein